MPDTLTELYQRLADVERRLSSQERKAKASGWQLNSIFNTHRFGGGQLMWGFDGHSRAILSSPGGLAWTENAIADSNYRATTYGGPNITLDGGAEYLSNTDANWQESTTYPFLVWSWCYPTDISANRMIAAKYLWSTNNRSWYLRYDLALTDFTFLCNATGLAGGNVVVPSTYGAVVADEWYFVAGYFEPSTLMRIYVGMNTDAGLTIDSLGVAVPASLYNGAADLTIGADGNPATYFLGNIGIVGARVNVPSAAIDDHVGMLFEMTKDIYEE